MWRRRRGGYLLRQLGVYHLHPRMHQHEEEEEEGEEERHEKLKRRDLPLPHHQYHHSIQRGSPRPVGLGPSAIKVSTARKDAEGIVSSAAL